MRFRHVSGASFVLALALVAGWVGCGEILPSPGEPPPGGGEGGTTEGGSTPVDGSTDGGGGGGVLSVAWHRELLMESDGGVSIGGYVAATRAGGAEFVSSATGDYSGKRTNESDALLVSLGPDGGTENVRTFGGPGIQFARYVLTDSTGRLSIVMLDTTAEPWVSKVRRVDNPEAGPNADLGSAGRTNVWAIASWSQGFFYAGAGTNSGAAGPPWHAVYGAIGASAGRTDDSNDSEAFTVAAIPEGVIVGGHFLRTIGLPPCTRTLDAGALPAGFVMRLNADRSCRWLRSFAASGASRVTAVAANGYLVASGSFSGTFAENGHAANDGIWLAHLDVDTGETKWLRTFTSIGASSPRSIGVDHAGRSVVTGSLGSSIDFGAGSIRSDGTANAFVASFREDGALDQALRFGTGDVQSFSLAIGPANQVYVAGTVYAGTLGFPGSAPASPLTRTFVVAFDRK
jgi:hypothetical protein